MSNVHRLHQQTDQDDLVLDQASDWVAKMDRGLTSQETSDFQRWQHESPLNMKVMFEVAQMWDKLDELNRLSDVFPKSSVKHKIISNKLIALAASLFLVVSVFFLQTSQSPLKSTSQYATLTTQYQTGVGERNTIHLPDSSVLVLNTNSVVNINYNQQARVIELKQGELHIEVAHNKSRPLQVVAAGKVIQAVGTAFNVQITQGQVELIVTDGKVLVDNDTSEVGEKHISSSAIPVVKGETINLNKSLSNAKQTLKKTDNNEISSKLSWRKGNLIFRGDSLADAIQEISRYTDISFEFADDEALKAVEVAGVFKTSDIDGLLSVLDKSFNIKHKKIGTDKILLSFKI